VKYILYQIPRIL